MPRRKAASGASRSVEDFLKAIYRLQRNAERVSTSALANALNVSAPAVTDMAQRLLDEGTVDYLKYRGVRLTDEGKRVALDMLRRHRLIEAYLVEDLGYQLHEVHEEAEALEHTVSDRFVEAIARKLGNPPYDPHGDPIPSRDGLMARQDLQPLSQLPTHAPARIRRFITDDPRMLQETQKRGLTLGATVVVLARDELEGPLEAQLPSGRSLIIGFKMASEIMVEAL